AFADRKRLSALLSQHGVRVRARQPSSGDSAWFGVLEMVIPMLLVGSVAWFLLRRASRGSRGLGAGGLSGFERSGARRTEDRRVDTTFDDVQGIDEAKADLAQIVEFLRRPASYARLGGHIPRGVLLAGAPGTGKTLLARAVAGQAGVPFFQISASEFVEMIVGVGAARVRDLFAQAKAEAPAIVFIDELDAIGRKRGAAGGAGGSDEREQTLDQILTEMDGFDADSGVIVIAATNRPEILDPALLRPGRFDRRVSVSAPDRAGRRRILEVHTQRKPLATAVDLDVLARMTPGMVGADLANLCNEAALLAAARGALLIAMDDFTIALERIVLGAERPTLLGEDDRRRIAYHEAGHAIVGMLTELADPVRKVTIVPRGRSLGVTLSAPDTDQVNYRRGWLLARLKVTLGGRVAEDIVFGDITTGAENDIEQLTRIARAMVGRWGMSEAIGPVAVLPADDERMPFTAAEVSAETRREVDREVRRIIDEMHREVTQLLIENRARLDGVAAALLEHETLDEVEVRVAAGLAGSGAKPHELHEEVARPVATDDEPVPGLAVAGAGVSEPR
ncbi:MAG TPA: ATP-dependent zinc metalloprotease FtsH, partial [Candidatus Limnocylindria bacterium]|nr:ATP-dependent zinc metalloprotease FtsH [Candidatus Limnocylindria bacterium]